MENNNKPGQEPERDQPQKEQSDYPYETEFPHPHEGDGDSYSENTDVTGPDEREFPSEGQAETDFVSRPRTRTTGRMVGHEPGIDNNL